MRVLVLSFQALGNAVLTLPLLAGLREAWPWAEIHVVCHGAAAELFTASPSVDRVLHYDKAALRARGWLARRAFEAAFLTRAAAGGYDVVLDLHGGPRSAAIALATGARLRIGYGNRVRGRVFHRRIARRAVVFDPAQPPSRKRHEIDHLLDFARAAGVEPAGAPIAPCLLASGETSSVGPAYAVLHPGSSDVRKNWPLPHFVRLAREIEDRLGLTTHYCIGPMDGAAGAALARQGVDERAIERPTGLSSLASLLGHASLFVGNDSGPAHLAAALGRPTVAIFGPTDEAFTGPRAPRGATARAAALDLPCRPCLAWGECARRRCLEDLAPAAVADLATEILAADGTGRWDGAAFQWGVP